MSWWYIDNHTLRARNDQGSWFDGFYPNSLGDSIYHTAMLVMYTGDDEKLMVLIRLLNERKRWPDEFNHPQMAKNRLDKFLHPKKYRWQHGMTRDPYILVISAMKLMGCVWEKEIHRIKIPWWLYRPNLWAWHKYLSTGEIKYKHRYEWWAGLSIKFSSKNIPTFVTTLRAWKAYIAESDKIKKKLHPDIKDWNILQRLLANKDIDPVKYKKVVFSYIAKTKIQWSADDWIKPGIWDDDGFWIDEEVFLVGNILPLDDEIKLDKDIIEYLFKLIYK